MKNRKPLLIFCTGAVLYAVFLLRGNYTNKVIFTGDEWDYQSIGVNYQYGHGFLTTGPVEGFDVYKLDSLDDGRIRFWENFSGKKAYHRGPFYPAFACLFYKLFGINPIIIKYFQLLILIVSGSLLPIIGRLAWGEKGFYFGLAGFIIFVFLNHRFSEHLMPENWQFLFLSLIIICLFYHHRGSKLHSALLGILLDYPC